MARRSTFVAAATRKAYPRKKPKARLADYNPNAPDSQAFPGQQTFNDPWVSALINDGIDFWNKRNTPMPSSIIVDRADDLETVSSQPQGVAGRGWAASTTKDGLSRLVLKSDYINGLLTTARNESYPVKYRRRALKRLAAVVYHELGHVGGAQHSTDGKGLMGAGLDLSNPEDYSTIPFSAAVLIRKLIPHKTRAVKKKHH